jgi:hypothetical protein
MASVIHDFLTKSAATCSVTSNDKHFFRDGILAQPDAFICDSNKIPVAICTFEAATTKELAEFIDSNCERLRKTGKLTTSVHGYEIGFLDVRFPSEVDICRTRLRIEMFAVSVGVGVLAVHHGKLILLRLVFPVKNDKFLGHILANTALSAFHRLFGLTTSEDLENYYLPKFKQPKNKLRGGGEGEEEDSDDTNKDNKSQLSAASNSKEIKKRGVRSVTSQVSKTT